MVKVEIRCPACSKVGFIELEDKIINQSSRGVTAINVSNDQMCSHSFVAYVDKHMDVRDCFLTDFQIELPTMATEQIEEKEIPNQDVIDVDILKINLNALQLSSILRGCFFKLPVLILNNEDFLYNHIQNLFCFIFKNSFDYDIFTENSFEYKKNKKKYKNYLVLEGHKILKDKNKILDPKKIKIERSIMQKFYGEYNPKSSLIILKNEIQKSYDLSKQIMDIIKNYDGEEKLGKKKLIDKLVEIRDIKIDFGYLEFLLDIIKHYFEFDLSVLSDYYFPAFGI